MIKYNTVIVSEYMVNDETQHCNCFRELGQ